MKKIFLLSFLAVVALVAVKGCIFDPTKGDPIDKSGDYKPLTSPENVLNNLIVSYRRQEIEEYAKILDKEFIFRFQDGDEPPDLGRQFWVHDEDSTGTAALFTSPEVSGISIELTYRDAVPATEVNLLGTMKIRVTPMTLTVDDVKGITYLVQGDIQDMFFTRGEGADSTTWSLLEWRDIPGSGGNSAPGVQGLAEDGNVKRVTWGQLLKQQR